MDPKQLLAKSIQQAATCIGHAHDDDMGNATPCSEWDLHTLINHMVYELLWVPDLLKGKTVAEVGTAHDGDVLHSDFRSAWQHAADAALVATMHVDMDAPVHLSRGDKPARDYLLEMANDMLIHGWDVGRSLKCSVLFDHDVAQTIYDGILPHAAEYTASGDFGTPIEVPDNAPLQIKLLALEGRRADIEP